MTMTMNIHLTMTVNILLTIMWMRLLEQWNATLKNGSFPSGSVVHLSFPLLVLNPLLYQELCSVDAVLRSSHRHYSGSKKGSLLCSTEQLRYLFRVPGLYIPFLLIWMFAPLQNIYIELCLRQIVPFPQSTLALPCFVRYFGSSLRYAIEGPCPNIVF